MALIVCRLHGQAGRWLPLEVRKVQTIPITRSCRLVATVTVVAMAMLVSDEPRRAAC
ncbi:hypothetical protein DPMN_131005 [Dreissena polymorpha]|uniref:Uncharacterized protein n=1 Tax=Dreissena polymorpha TaxID=45954 RepID=A0A9D4H649_DREPO|nr:hypothetical protein DPMN_131005 [Dreissena polymorpha]